jgi:hypothetical protein
MQGSASMFSEPQTHPHTRIALLKMQLPRNGDLFCRSVSPCPIMTSDSFLASLLIIKISIVLFTRKEFANFVDVL